MHLALSCVTPKGLLNRAHAYKAALDKNLEAGRDADDGVNAGLYNYPVLMAADILLYNSDVVPVGLDQKQHIEITRDIAENFNRVYGKTLKLPEGLISEDVQSVPGIDGRKMSKSYNNTLPIFAPEKELRKQIMRIVTDSTPPEQPKNPDTCNLYQIYRLFAPPERLTEVRGLYLHGVAYGALKSELADLPLAYFPSAFKIHCPHRRPAHLDQILAQGAQNGHRRLSSSACVRLSELTRKVGNARGPDPAQNSCAVPAEFIRASLRIEYA